MTYDSPFCSRSSAFDESNGELALAPFRPLAIQLIFSVQPSKVNVNRVCLENRFNDTRRERVVLGPAILSGFGDRVGQIHNDLSGNSIIVRPG